MNMLSVFLLLIFSFLIGCTSGDGLEAIGPQGDENEELQLPSDAPDNGSAGDNDDSSNSGGGNTGGGNTGGGNTGGGNAGGGNTGGGNTGGGNTGGPQPGDMVENAPRDPRTTYPPVGEPLPSEPSMAEPNSDIYPPTISFVKVPSPILVATQGDFEVWVGDNDGGRGIDYNECQLDGKGWSTCENNFQYSGLSQGLHTVVARTVDRDGNVSGPVSYVFMVDTVPPTVQWTATPPKVSNSKMASFEFVGRDESSGIAKYECGLDSRAFETCSSPVALGNLTNGVHTYSVRAIDKANLVSEVISYTWTVDTNVPVVQITKGPGKISNQSTASFEFQGQAAGASPIQKYECQLDGGAYGVCTSPQNYGNLVDGDHDFSVRAVTTVGNVSAPAVFRWQIDTVKPTIAFIETPNNPSASPEARFVFEGKDERSGLAGYECNVNKVGYQPCSSPQSYTGLVDGVHFMAVRVSDKAGNVSNVVEHSWLVDLTAPTVTLTKAPLNPTKLSDALFEFFGADQGSGIQSYQCQIDGGGYKDCASGTNYSGLSEGNHTFQVTATDAVGNVSKPAEAWWVIDQTGPEIQFLTQPEPVIYVGDTGRTVFSIQDDSGLDSYQCKLNGMDQACALGQPLDIEAMDVSTWSLQVSATDVLGNASVATIQWRSEFNFVDSSTALAVSKDRPVDVLFVVDNSGSMDEERANLAQRIDGFISKIEGLDWQISVISTDVDTAVNGDGNFVELNGMPGEYILDSGMDVDLAQSVFGETVQKFGNGSPDEMGIYATKRAIDRYLAGGVNHREFFRDGADLSVVVLSDEDENSDGKNIKISPKNMVSFVDQTWSGEKNFTWHSMITKPDDLSCQNSQEFSNPGHIYSELSQLTGFGQVGGAIIGSVCDADYTSQLADIGQSVKDRQNTIELKCEPADVDGDGVQDFSVTYKGPNATSYSAFLESSKLIGMKLVFDDLLPPGDYKVDHKCLVK